MSDTISRILPANIADFVCSEVAKQTGRKTVFVFDAVNDGSNVSLQTDAFYVTINKIDFSDASDIFQVYFSVALYYSQVFDGDSWLDFLKIDGAYDGTAGIETAKLPFKGFGNSFFYVGNYVWQLRYNKGSLYDNNIVWVLATIGGSDFDIQ